MSSDTRSNRFIEPGGQRYFEQSKPLLSLSPPPCGATPGLRRPCESHTTGVGSRFASDSPGAWTEAWPGRGPKAMKQVADFR